MEHFSSLGYEAHAISLPGHGNSSLTKGHVNKYSARDYIECISAEIDRISPKPVLAGHSMGGYLTLKYLEANELPAAVLIASIPQSGLWTFMGRLFRRHFWTTTRIAMSGQSVVPTPEIAREMFLSVDTRVDVHEFHGRLVAESMLLGLEMSTWLRSRPEKVASPTFVIAAEQDALFSIREQERLARALNAKYALLPGTAHDVMLEPRSRVAVDMIDEWITRDLRLP